MADVDASFRLPALIVAAKSAVWLLLGTLLLLMASVKLHAPAMMSAKAWLTYGRLAPAGWDVVLYGFAGQAGLLAGLWVLARSCRQRLQGPGLLVAGLVVWNLGVLAGLIGILSGASTGRELLEMPAGAMACLVTGGALAGVTGWMTFSARTESSVYPSVWFVLLALLSFVWFGTAALVLLGGEGSRGVVQVLVQRWFAVGVTRLWLGALTVAVVTYLLPAILGRPLASRQLAVFGFWALAFFAPWSVAAHGDPFPRWVVSAGLAGRFLATIAVLAIGLNWLKTAEGALGQVVRTDVGRLVGGAAVVWVLAGFLGFLGAFQKVSAVARLTWVHQGMDWLWMGGAMLAAFAALPTILGRIGGRPLSPGLVGLHGTLTLAGIVVLALSLLLAGWVQGRQLSGNTAAYIDTVKAGMHFVRLSTLGLVLLLGAQVVWVAALVNWFRGLAMEAAGTAKTWLAISTPSGKHAGVRS